MSSPDYPAPATIVKLSDAYLALRRSKPGDADLRFVVTSITPEYRIIRVVPVGKPDAPEVSYDLRELVKAE